MADLVQAVERMVELAEETLASELPDGEAREKVAALARVGREALAAHASVERASLTASMDAIRGLVERGEVLPGWLLEWAEAQAAKEEVAIHQGGIRADGSSETYGRRL